MTSRRDLKIGIAVLLLAIGFAASATEAGDPLHDAVAALDRRDGIAAEVAVGKAQAAGRPRAEFAAYIGEAKLLQGDMAEAARWLGPGQFSPGTRQRGFHALGRLNMARTDYAGAARAYNFALSAGPANAGLWVDIGGMRYRSGEQHLALDAVARALAIDAGNTAALAFRAQLARDAQGLVAALPWYERALRRAPDDLELLAGYGATLGDAGQSRAMLAVARRMVEIDPRDPRAYYLQAVLAARAGRVALARRLMWLTGGKLDTKPAGLLVNGILELAEGNAALAVEQFDDLVRAQPQNRHAQRLLGRALLANGEANEVIARLSPFADRRHAGAYMLALVGRAQEQQGQRARAAPYLQRATTRLDDTVSVLPVDAAGDFAIWQWQRGEGRPGGAVPLLRRFVGRGQPGEARRQADALLARYPGSADMALLAGDVALLTGDPAAASGNYARAGLIRRDHGLALRSFYVDRALGRDPVPGLKAYLHGNPRALPVQRALDAWLKRDKIRAGPQQGHVAAALQRVTRLARIRA